MKGKQAILRYLETHRTFTAKVNCAPDPGQLMQPDSIDIVPG